VRVESGLGAYARWRCCSRGCCCCLILLRGFAFTGFQFLGHGMGHRVFLHSGCTGWAYGVVLVVFQIDDIIFANARQWKGIPICLVARAETECAVVTNIIGFSVPGLLVIFTCSDGAYFHHVLVNCATVYMGR
jgi:hypothetical protein